MAPTASTRLKVVPYPKAQPGPGYPPTMNPQWQFTLETLRQTPSSISMVEEMSRRQRGVDWLMRMGATLDMGLGPCLTAATYFHRFYMRRMLEDYNELEIGATCLFLASKTEENGKRLEDIVTVMLAKVHGVAPAEVAGMYESEAKSLEHLILTYEEVLLEVLCFDFDVRYPHTYLADILATYDANSPDPLVHALIDCAWSVAHDSYRTPLCILLSPKVIAAAAFLFAQCLAEGPVSPSLSERLDVFNPADTPWCQVIGISGNDVQQVAVGLIVMCQFYGAAVRKDKGKPDITPYKLIVPPSVDLDIPVLFSLPEAQPTGVDGAHGLFSPSEGSKTPKTPATQKSIPSTPFQPLAPASPVKATTPGQT